MAWKNIFDVTGVSLDNVAGVSVNEVVPIEQLNVEVSLDGSNQLVVVGTEQDLSDWRMIVLRNLPVSLQGKQVRVTVVSAALGIPGEGGSPFAGFAIGIANPELPDEIILTNKVAPFDDTIIEDDVIVGLEPGEVVVVQDAEGFPPALLEAGDMLGFYYERTFA